MPTPFNEHVKITKMTVRQMEYGRSSQIEFLFKNENWTTQLVFDREPLFDELKEVEEGEFRMVKGWKDYNMRLITLISIMSCFYLVIICYYISTICLFYL